VQHYRPLPGPLEDNLVFYGSIEEAFWNKCFIFWEDLQIKTTAKVMDEAKVVADAGAVEEVEGDRGATMKNFSITMLTKHHNLYRAITCHQLVSGMAGATLPLPVFRAYIIQDYMYLKSFSEFLRVLAARSERDTECEMFQRHSRESAAAEVAMHESFFPLLDVSPTTLEAAKPLPGYVQNSQLLKETYLSAPFPNAMAAIIPCYRAYLEMGRKVALHKPANPLYSKWAALYSCPDYEKAVLEIEHSADAHATEQTAPEMEAFYIRSCLLEAGFLDAVYGHGDHMEAKK